MKRFVLLGLGPLCVLLLFTTAGLYAAGTPAGTVITNTATMNYKDLAGNSFPAVNASVSITVAQLAGVAVTPPTAAQTRGDSLFVYYPFTVTNTGNGTDKYSLTDLSTQGWGPVLFKDSNKNGVLDAGELAAGAVTQTDSIPEDSSQNFIARIFVPYPTPSGTVDSLHVTASSQYTPATSASGTYVTTITAAVVPLTKSANNHSPQPGQTITYTIGYHNTGTSPALNAVVTDTLSTDLTVGTINDGGTYNPANRVLTWNLGQINGGASGSVSFQAAVNTSPLVPATTVIHNVANVTFVDSTNGHHLGNPSPDEPVTVVEKGGLAATIAPAAITQDVGLVAQYEITLKNLGNFTDSASFAFTTSFGLGWAFFTDANGDGIVNGTDHLITPADLGPIAQLDSMKFIARDTIPHASPDRTVDTLKVTFTSLAHPAVTAASTGLLTIRAPQMTLTKTVGVVGGGLPVPGAQLLYTITYADTGSGAASGVVITDPIPANTTYDAVYGIKINGVAGGSFGAGLVTVNLGTVAAGETKQITFQVTIQ